MYDCKNYREIENNEKIHIAMANFAPPADLLWDTSPAADRDQRADFDTCPANCDRFAIPDAFAYANQPPNRNAHPSSQPFTSRYTFANRNTLP